MAASTRSPRGIDVTPLVSILNDLTGNRPVLAAWLRRFAAPELALHAAGRSYWHPNGFAKIVLEAGPNHKVRLHVWPAGEHRLGESNPHGHRWDFASTVLCGAGLTDTHYVESGMGSRYIRHAYMSGTLSPVGDVLLEEGESHDVHTRDIYTIDTKIVHTVRPLGTALVATLVVQGKPRLESAPVYCLPGTPVDEPVKPISADEVRDLVHQVLNASDFG